MLQVLVVAHPSCVLLFHNLAACMGTLEPKALVLAFQEGLLQFGASAVLAAALAQLARVALA